ncbi:uncharacterized protein LOC123723332 [Papilio machaon]|uniref:uncharacterized protein LOC123723332 n=1 Tax=Papilio machaon TaxID=76193 RepID=UPI001E6646CC|nr:uncharacterized protein LOC123723332 [Papilio machaon]
MCESCMSECASIPETEKISGKSVSIEQLIMEVNKKLEVVFKIERSLEDMKTTVDFYAEKYQELFEFKKKTENKVKYLEQQTVYLEKRNKALEERIVDMEQKEKERNIEIVGLEKKDNEDLKSIMATLSKKVGVLSEDIEQVKRVGQEKQDKQSRPLPIIVTLRTKTAREQWLKQRKQVITNDDIYNDHNNNRIYINEDLSKYLRQIFWMAKKELKPMYKYIWVQNSKILVKASEVNKKIHAIRSQEDITQLMKCATRNDNVDSETTSRT